jgi:GTP cyclohydrolase II
VTTLPLDLTALDDAFVELPAVGATARRAGLEVSLYARARLPTRYGDFSLFVFRSSADDKEHLALVRGLVSGATGVPVRVHSECLTGDVLASLRCDCRDQLELAMTELGRSEPGVLVYLRQEGRGIGLGNKVRAYALQEQGLDTYEANRHLGFDDDLRTYDIAALILEVLGVGSIELATNNPDKLFGLRAAGTEVIGRRPLVAKPGAHNADYLATKKQSGHMV